MRAIWKELLKKTRMVVNEMGTRPPAYYYQFIWDILKSGVSADNSGIFWVGRPPYIPDSRVVTSRSHAYKRGLGATDNTLYIRSIWRCTTLLSSPTRCCFGGMGNYSC